MFAVAWNKCLLPARTAGNKGDHSTFWSESRAVTQVRDKNSAERGTEGETERVGLFTLKKRINICLWS